MLPSGHKPPCYCPDHDRAQAVAEFQALTVFGKVARFLGYMHTISELAKRLSAELGEGMSRAAGMNILSIMRPTDYDPYLKSLETQARKIVPDLPVIAKMEKNLDREFASANLGGWFMLRFAPNTAHGARA